MMNPASSQSLSYVIKKEGFETLTAEDGEEGLNKARAMSPDLIVLDVMMPKKTGFEVCEELRKDESTKGIYVIILTARGEEWDEQRGREVGADEYMTKPFSPRKVSARLHEILG